MAAEPPPPAAWWLSLVPVAGCAGLGASTLSIYFSDLATEAWCAGTPVCRGFVADPRALSAGIGFLVFACALLVGTVVVATRGPGAGRPGLAPVLCVGVASSFALLVLLLTATSLYVLSSAAIPLIIWAFLGVGYLILWTVTAFPSSVVGAWGFAARGLAAVHGAVSFIVTGFTLKAALVPGHFFV